MPKVISWRLAIEGVGQITAFYFQQIVIIRTDRRPSSSPPASIWDWLGTRSWSSWTFPAIIFIENWVEWPVWTAHPKDGVVEVTLYLGGVHPGWEGPDLQLLPGVLSSAQLGVGGHQVVRLHALKYSMFNHFSNYSSLTVFTSWFVLATMLLLLHSGKKLMKSWGSCPAQTSLRGGWVEVYLALA